MAYQQAFELDDENESLIINMARFAKRQGDMKLHASLAKRVKRIRLRNPYHHFLLARLSFEQGALKESKKRLNKAIALFDADARFYAFRARVNQNIGHHRRALKDWVRAEQLAQSSSERFAYGAKAAWTSSRYHLKMPDHEFSKTNQSMYERFQFLRFLN